MMYGLKSDTIEKILFVLSNYQQIEKAILYGSRAKGTYKNGSDIDITFVGQDVDISLINKVAMELDELLLPYTFDLSVYKNISNEDLREHISRVGILIYQKKR
jgi:uncharacterized protein